MARENARGMHAGHGLLSAGLLPILLLACGNGLRHGDAASPEPGLDAGPTRPELRVGFAGGSSCDSSAQCLSGACTLGLCSDWAYAMRIVVDTSSTGADITQDVSDFPLLLRLRSTNFAFAEARHDGADLRFVDGSGHSLSHEIERWNPTLGLGDVWVLLPRIEGGRNDNAFLMYWGNAQAAAVSSGPSVFGSLACALHMAPAADGLDAHLEDASGHNNTGVVKVGGQSHWQASEGIAGSSLLLDGMGTSLGTSAVAMSPPTFTLSLWLATTSTAPAGIAGFLGSNPGEKMQFDRAIWMDANGRLSFGVLRTTSMVKVASLTGYNDGAWHHVVARASGNGQYLFVDGESIADDPTRSGSNSFRGSWSFGQDPSETPPLGPDDASVYRADTFAGRLDEIRVATSEQSDAWIKLAYATQRPQATAVRYQRLP
jgi:hypothetical protein